MLAWPRAGHRWTAALLATASLLCSGLSRAQVPVVAPAGSAPVDSEARQHFERALELYRGGKYGSARDELKAAAALDPNGKDLFFNLALVHEKLGQLEDAIVALQRFRELESDQAERERARLTIERLRGAERAAATPARAPCLEPPPPARAPSDPRPVLIGAASVAIVSAVVGSVFGLKALSDDVGDKRTSGSLSLGQLRERGRRAEREALVSDIAFAVTAAAGGTFACVWLLSPGENAKQGAGITLQGYF